MRYIGNSKQDKLNSQEQLAFLDYLANSLTNGFSLNASLELMPAMWPQKAALLTSLATRMKQGGQLDQEMIRLGFNKTTATQINLAMAQGGLLECLQQLAKLSRLKNEQFKRLKVELSYPFVLAVMMILLLVFMQTFVSQQFADSGEWGGDALLVFIVAAVIFIICYLAKILSLLARQDYRSLTKLIKYPLIGTVIKTYASYLLVYDIGLLLASGFSLLSICRSGRSQEPESLQYVISKRVEKQLANGRNLTEVIKEEKFLPDALLVLLQTGATKRDLGKRCLVLGQSLFMDLTAQIEKIVVNVQPFSFILIGLCIIGMYLKLLLPMYSMMQGI